MCGIVGHIGPAESVKVVLEGLKRLEYRGYDSAGIAFVDPRRQLQLFKTTGKVQNLVNLLNTRPHVAEASIGHTRWATHGEVTDCNAHPHGHGQISMVHNGIIENYQELKRELATNGYNFVSDTDSETFLALILKEMEAGAAFRQAICAAFSRVRGHSAFVVLDAVSKEIVAIKRGAPLVCGIGEVNSQVLVSSDPYALAGLAEKIYFPEDEVVCSLGGSNRHLLNFFELDGSPSERYARKAQILLSDTTDKGDHEHFMLKEIHEQPGLIRALPLYYLEGEGKALLENIANLRPKTIHMSACGTAHYACLLIRDYLESLNRIRTDVSLASEFRYRNPLITKDDLGIFVSQSGETADTLAAQEYCDRMETPTLALLNVEESTLYRKCDFNLPIRAGVEIGVASTKAFTQMALTGRLLAFALDRNSEDKGNLQLLQERFNLLADRIDEILSRTSEIRDVAEKLYNYKGYFYTGRGIYYPTALEGALKLKEISYVHAEGYASGELKHGPIALIDEEIVNIAIVGPELYEKTVSNIQEVKARKGIIAIIGPEDKHQLHELGDYIIPANFQGLGELSPLYINVINQLLAYYIARFKGTDIDRPRNLAKSVTVE